MGDNIGGIGWMIRCMEMGSLSGLRGKAIRERIRRI
jgi:hypothetical protein